MPPGPKGRRLQLLLLEASYRGFRITYQYNEIQQPPIRHCNNQFHYAWTQGQFYRKLTNVRFLLEELPKSQEETEASHRLLCPGGQLTFDWTSPNSIWIAGIESQKENRGIARALLEKIYEIGSGGTIHLGTIVAHPAAAAGILRIQERFAVKYNVTIGQYRLDPHPRIQK